MTQSKSALESIFFAPDTPLIDILNRQNEAIKLGVPAGIAIIVTEKKQIIGTITDGDIRRTLIKHQSFEVAAEKIMNRNPVFLPDSFSYRQIIETLPKELQKRGRSSKNFLSKIILVNPENVPTRIIDYHQLWEQKVANHRHIVVLGMGYVGFTLSLVLADRGFQVTGVDLDDKKIASLKKGESYIHEKGLDELFNRQLNHNFKPTLEIPESGDVYIISVGTPVYKRPGESVPTPDLSYLTSAAESVGKYLKSGDLVILRSTVPIGTTRNVVLPILEKHSGLKGGIDFHLCFAPERTAEGKAVKELRELPQLLGGLNEESTEATAAIFKELTPTLVRVKTLEQAEMSKLLNNCFRDLVFSFSNHVAQIANHFNIDVLETIQAANQGYPRNPIPLPSPGVGGACLTKDPYIFSAVAKPLGIETTLFESGRAINEAMHQYVVDNVMAASARIGKKPEALNVLICGLAFKGEPETGDLRNSSAIEIANLLKSKVKRVYGQDAVATLEDIINEGLTPVELPDGFKGMDLVLFLNNHRSYQKIDLTKLLASMNENPIFYDGWGIFDKQDVLKAGPCIYMNLSSNNSSLNINNL